MRNQSIFIKMDHSKLFRNPLIRTSQLENHTRGIFIYSFSSSIFFFFFFHIVFHFFSSLLFLVQFQIILKIEGKHSKQCISFILFLFLVPVNCFFLGGGYCFFVFHSFFLCFSYFRAIFINFRPSFFPMSTYLIFFHFSDFLISEFFFLISIIASLFCTHPFYSHFLSFFFSLPFFLSILKFLLLFFLSSSFVLNLFLYFSRHIFLFFSYHVFFVSTINFFSF